MAFLRQFTMLTDKFAKLTDKFSKFYEQAPESSDSESSDDECDFTATQSTASSQRTLSQNSVNADNEMDVDIVTEQVSAFPFENSNGDQPNVDSHMDIIDGSSQFSFEMSQSSIHPWMLSTDRLNLHLEIQM